MLNDSECTTYSPLRYGETKYVPLRNGFICLADSFSPRLPRLCLHGIYCTLSKRYTSHISNNFFQISPDIALSQFIHHLSSLQLLSSFLTYSRYFVPGLDIALGGLCIGKLRPRESQVNKRGCWEKNGHGIEKNERRNQNNGVTGNQLDCRHEGQMVMLTPWCGD